jgi:hypothetical protein
MLAVAASSASTPRGSPASRSSIGRWVPPAEMRGRAPSSSIHLRAEPVVLGETPRKRESLIAACADVL